MAVLRQAHGHRRRTPHNPANPAKPVLEPRNQILRPFQIRQR